MNYAWLVISASFVLARAHSLDAEPADATHGINPAFRLAKRDECGFAGNPDIYGLGIRIGYYSQALSVWIANFFVFKESEKLRSVNTLFMFALFIGLTWISHDPSKTYAIEAFLLIQLLSATWYVSILNQSKFSNKHRKFSPLRIVIQDLTFLGLLAYSIWFWWNGLDLLQQTPCGTYIFFLSKVNLYGWYRSGFKVLSILAICCRLVILTGHTVQWVQHRLTSYIRSPQYFQSLHRNLELQRDAQRLGCNPRNQTRKDINLLAPAQEVLPVLINRDTSASKPTADAAMGRNLDTLMIEPDRPIKTSSEAYDSQDRASQLATIQNIEENAIPKHAISRGLKAQDNYAHYADFQSATPTSDPSGSAGPESKVPRSPLLSTSAKDGCPGSKSSPLSGSRNLGSGARSQSTLSPASPPHGRSDKNISPLPQIGPTVTLQSPPDRLQSSRGVMPSNTGNPESSSTPISFEDIAATDTYLDSILKDVSSVQPARTYHIPYTFVKIYIPSIPDLRNIYLNPHKHQFRPRILLPVFIHIYYLRTYPYPLYPTLLCFALNSPLYTKISPTSLVVTMVLRTSRLPDHTPPYHYLPSAFCTLMVCIGLVLAVELSLYWNSISGVTNMGQVGQLVPLVVGIGGLVKVLWVWLKREGNEVEGEGPLEREVRACAEIYEELKGTVSDKNEIV